MREFDLTAAKRGEPICLRNGTKARIICFDRKSKKGNIILLADEGDSESVFSCLIVDGEGPKSQLDMMMVYDKPMNWFQLLIKKIGLKK